MPRGLHRNVSVQERILESVGRRPRGNLAEPDLRGREGPASRGAEEERTQHFLAEDQRQHHEGSVAPLDQHVANRRHQRVVLDVLDDHGLPGHQRLADLGIVGEIDLEHVGFRVVTGREHETTALLLFHQEDRAAVGIDLPPDPVDDQVHHAPDVERAGDALGDLEQRPKLLALFLALASGDDPFLQASHETADVWGGDAEQREGNEHLDRSGSRGCLPTHDRDAAVECGHRQTRHPAPEQLGRQRPEQNRAQEGEDQPRLGTGTDDRKGHGQRVRDRQDPVKAGMVEPGARDEIDRHRRRDEDSGPQDSRGRHGTSREDQDRDRRQQQPAEKEQQVPGVPDPPQVRDLVTITKLECGPGEYIPEGGGVKASPPPA
jgi:hypothetical protein